MQEKMFWLTFNNQHSNNPATRSLIDNGEIQLRLPVFFLFYLRVLVCLFRFQLLLLLCFHLQIQPMVLNDCTD